jgi:aspartyl-tRNA(Asn)/glutamyl-tRNA(Gln) amidotransferase subunit A
MGRLTVGTDGGGSIRIPSAFSGLVGLKPTYGRVPWWPPSPYGTVAHAGPMASTVADAALMLDVITEPDARDPLALPAEDNVDYLEAIEGGVEGLRIAFSPDFGYVDVDSEVERPVRDAVRAFEELGAQVEEVDPSFEDPVHIFKVHWYAAAANILRAFGDADRDLIDPGFVEVAEEGSRYSALEYLEAVDFRNELRLRTSEFHETYDLLLSPTLPIGAFEAGREVPEGWPHRRWTSWAPFSYPFNLTQQPAASVPCGFTGSGLPVGLQIVGGRYQDALVLRAAHAYQTTHSLTEQRPSFSGGEGRGK